MRFLLRFLLVLVMLVVASGFLLVARINTESNKSAISETVLAATGYELTIGGDLSLSLFPDLGLALTDVRLKNPAFPQELASTSSAVLSVELTPLLRGQIKIRKSPLQIYMPTILLMRTAPASGPPEPLNRVRPAATRHPGELTEAAGLFGRSTAHRQRQHRHSGCLKAGPLSDRQPQPGQSGYQPGRSPLLSGASV